MAKTTHVVRSSTCARCRLPGATQRCSGCSKAFYCSAACAHDDAKDHSAACAAVADAMQCAAARQLGPQETAALADFVTVVDFQLSLPPLEDDATACAMELSSPSAAANGSSSAAAFLGERVEALEAVVDWLASQAPCLLNQGAANVLLDHAIRLRDEGLDAEVQLLAWAILDRCLTAGMQQFQDALTLQHSSFSEGCWSPCCNDAAAGGAPCASGCSSGTQTTCSRNRHQAAGAFNSGSCSRAFGGSGSSPCGGGCAGGNLVGLPLVSATANRVLDMLAPVTIAAHADQNPLLLTPLEMPPMMFPMC